jgi:lysyl-tRNA synthetase class 2
VQPCFLEHHPAELVPLARRSDEDGTRLDMFQVVVHGWEISKGYSELIDPFEQRARLEEQLELREAGDDETMMMEDDFIEAMEYGMPPMSGVGIGIDRLVALLTDAPTLRDVVLFPQMQDKPAAGSPGGTAAEGGPDHSPDDSPDERGDTTVRAGVRSCCRTACTTRSSWTPGPPSPARASPSS